jgi:hypothetical protein
VEEANPPSTVENMVHHLIENIQIHILQRDMDTDTVMVLMGMGMGMGTGMDIMDMEV